MTKDGQMTVSWTGGAAAEGTLAANVAAIALTEGAGWSPCAGG